MTTLQRRGFDLGPTSSKLRSSTDNPAERWAQGLPITLEGQLTTRLSKSDQIENRTQTEHLVISLLESKECATLLSQPPYADRLAQGFDCLGSAYNQGDEQEIDMLMFDAHDNGCAVAEDLWMKISWLSFYPEDASLRFRFSFGVDHAEDVAADKKRQHYAGLLADAIFPESALITENNHLQALITDLLNSPTIAFVERIVYFNGPDGGAYLHHDLERGHAGVVFAQLSGTTYWLALPKYELLEAIRQFVNIGNWPDSITLDMQRELQTLTRSDNELISALDSFTNDTLIHLINETQSFVQFLIQRGHGYTLHAGDVILLPQTNQKNCCWHSVFCLGDEMGQGLSFAIRSDD